MPFTHPDKNVIFLGIMVPGASITLPRWSASVLGPQPFPSVRLGFPVRCADATVSRGCPPGIRADVRAAALKGRFDLAARASVEDMESSCAD